MSFIRKHLDSALGRFEHNYVTHNRIEVSRSALLHNLALFVRITNGRVIPVLKGNAYGHGIALVARALENSTLPYIAVDGYFEALRIREVSSHPVLIMGAIAPQNYRHLTYDNFAFVVDNEESIRALGNTKKRINVHLEINTGMNRYGVKPADIEGLVTLILSYKNLTLEGVMSHLADSDGTDRATVDTATDTFDACVELLHATGAQPTLIHIAQSAGSIKVSSRYANTIRLGIGLYGSNPFPQHHKLHAQLQDLQPALALISTITKIIELQPGDKVSYNYTFTAPEAMKIAVLPLGYYEGLNRALSNAGHVKIGTSFAPIIGRVCMNHTMINLNHGNAQVGDEVIIYSSARTDKNAVDAIAHEFELFQYNLLTALSPDVRRVLVD